MNTSACVFLCADFWACLCAFNIILKSGNQNILIVWKTQMLIVTLTMVCFSLPVSHDSVAIPRLNVAQLLLIAFLFFLLGFKIYSKACDILKWKRGKIALQLQIRQHCSSMLLFFFSNAQQINLIDGSDWYII